MIASCLQADDHWVMSPAFGYNRRSDERLGENLHLSVHSSSSSIYWTGPFPGIKSPIEACAGVCSLETVNIKIKFK